jgi:hypothetical protein
VDRTYLGANGVGMTRAIMIIGVLTILHLVACTGQPKLAQEQVVGTWRFWPGSRCASSELLNDELTFASNGTYAQTTTYKNGVPTRSQSNTWRLVRGDVVQLDGWLNVLTNSTSGTPSSAEFTIDLRRPPVLRLKTETDCYYSQPK